jgi:nitroreductase
MVNSAVFHMKTDNTSSILAALRWRYSTKQFDPARSIPPEDWEMIEQSLVLTPSSFGLQPWKFIVVEDDGIRAALQQESWNQPQVTEASKFLVLAARTDLTEDDIDSWIDCMCAVQGRDAESLAPLRGMMVGFAAAKTPEERHQWNARQVYIALGQLMTTAAMLGIDACPMEGISAAAYDRLLGLEESGYATAVACALGYRAESDKYAATPKARFSRDRLIGRV